MTISGINQVLRENDEYVEIVKTEVELKNKKETDIKSIFKSLAIKCYEDVSKNIMSLYEKFNWNKQSSGWIAISDKSPKIEDGEIYSKEYLVIDKFKERYLAVYSDKFLTWYDSSLAPLGKIENVTHYMDINNPA